MEFTTTAQIKKRWNDVHEEDKNEWEAALKKYDLKRREDANQKGPRIKYEDGTKPNISPEQISESKEVIKYKNLNRSMARYNKALIKKYQHKVQNLKDKCKCGEIIGNVKKLYFENCSETEELRDKIKLEISARNLKVEEIDRKEIEMKNVA